eukprot:2133606-Rhodomonas_salina.2
MLGAQTQAVYTAMQLTLPVLHDEVTQEKNKYSGVASNRDQSVFSSQGLSLWQAIAKPLLNLALSMLCDVHCLPLHMRAEALAMQLGTGQVEGVGINTEQIASVLATPVIMRRALKSPIYHKKFDEWKKLYTSLLKKKFSPVRTVLTMEKYGLSHQTLNGIRPMSQLAPAGFFSGHTVLTTTRRIMMDQAKCATPIVSLPIGAPLEEVSGYWMNVTAVLRQSLLLFACDFPNLTIFPEYPNLPDCLFHPAPPSLCLRWKVTLDSCEVNSETHKSHTELMIVFLPDNISACTLTCQSPSYHYTVAVYEGKDYHAGLSRHFGHLAREKHKLRLVCLFHWAHHIVPEFIMPADMANHWGIFGCGGVHNSKKQCCHHCNMKTAD